MLDDDDNDDDDGDDEDGDKEEEEVEEEDALVSVRGVLILCASTRRSSNSSDIALARRTRDLGRPAREATFIPNDLEHTPGMNLYKNVTST